MLPAFQFQFLL